MFKRWFKSAREDGPDPLSPIPEESNESFPSVLEESVHAPDPSPEPTPVPFSSIPRRCSSVYLKPMVATVGETL